MKRRSILLSTSLLALLLFVGGRALDEGMWLLDSINKLPLSEMRKHGLKLTPEQIYSANGPSIKDAVMVLSGGTATFVSSQGLILTNHHVAFGGIQSLSSLEADYLRDGFWAKTMDEELATNYTADMVISMKDVTREVLAGIADSTSADERDRIVRSKSIEIESKAKGEGEYTCRVMPMYGGVQYYLFISERLLDIRLAYAPPQAIGNFGGEVDNWIWPRHTGDFAFMRAYVGPNGKPAKYAKANKPYRPKVFLPISTQGFSEGSFAMILGFPGRTFRYREASAVQLARDETLPLTIDLYGARINVIEQFSKKDRQIGIKYASKVRRIANAYKNYQGTLEGMRKSDLLTMKTREESGFAKFVSSNPSLAKKYDTVIDDLKKANADLQAVNKKSIMLNNFGDGVDMIRIGSRLLSYAKALGDKKKSEISGIDTVQSSAREFLARSFKDIDINVDKEILVQLLLKAADMPADQRLEFVSEIVGKASVADREKKIRKYVDNMYEDSKITSRENADALLATDPDGVKDDELVKLAVRYNEEQGPVQTKVNAANNKLTRLRTRFVEGWLDWKKSDTPYPDANRTLRLTYGEVKPFSPRDGVEYRLATTLGGVIEKETGVTPFIVPAKLKELWLKKNFGRYADPELKDVQVAFITNNDITGGNSGSAIINGNGELIGCAFDGNWEGVVGDYFFEEKVNRTISVDARYILFVLDKYSGAENILREMSIR